MWSVIKNRHLCKTQMAIDLLKSFKCSRLVFLHWGFREDYPERQSHYQSEASEDIPAGTPACPYFHRTCCNHRFGVNEVVHNCVRCQSTDSSAKSVGHHHEQTLCAGALAWVGLLIYIQRTRDVEEIERKAIDDTA